MEIADQLLSITTKLQHLTTAEEAAAAAAAAGDAGGSGAAAAAAAQRGGRTRRATRSSAAAAAAAAEAPQQQQGAAPAGAGGSSSSSAAYEAALKGLVVSALSHVVQAITQTATAFTFTCQGRQALWRCCCAAYHCVNTLWLRCLAGSPLHTTARCYFTTVSTAAAPTPLVQECILRCYVCALPLLPLALQLDSAPLASRHKFRDEASKDPTGLKARVQKVTSEMAGARQGCMMLFLSCAAALRRRQQHQRLCDSLSLRR